MRKILPLTLALMLVLSMSAAAFAEDSTIGSESGTASGNVTVEVTGYDTIVYAVTIQWTDMAFEYEFTGWDTKDHYYTGVWKDTSATVTVTNDSNIAIKATATVEDANDNDGIDVAVVGEATKTLIIAATDSFELKASGTPSNNSADYTAATVKISIAKT